MTVSIKNSKDATDAHAYYGAKRVLAISGGGSMVQLSKEVADAFWERLEFCQSKAEARKIAEEIDHQIMLLTAKEGQESITTEQETASRPST